MSHIYCQECGFQNPEAANYCARCGALLVKDDGGTESTQTFTPDDGEDTSSEVLEDLGITGPALVVRSGGGRAGETFQKARRRSAAPRTAGSSSTTSRSRGSTP
jgi:hypothetical protein